MTCCLSNVKHSSHESSSRIRLGMVKAYGASTMRFRVQGPYCHSDVFWEVLSPEGGHSNPAFGDAAAETN
jgi:hypothetical protein